MALTLFYITNNIDVALIVEKYGVDRVWIDLETLGKEQRQKGDTVKSKHSIADISKIKSKLTKAEMLVRINPINEGTKEEIDSVIEGGADIIMLPMWKSKADVETFINFVDGRVKTTLLLETKEAVECIDEVLEIKGIDEIHIGLNDLSISYGKPFMFEMLSNGLVETLCEKFKKAKLPYGFGGIARLGKGLLKSEKVIMEHYRLGSTRAILSRSFCNVDQLDSIEEIDRLFSENMRKLRAYEEYAANATEEDYLENKEEVIKCVEDIIETLNY